MATVAFYLATLATALAVWPLACRPGLAIVDAWLAARAVGSTILALLLLHLLGWTGASPDPVNFWLLLVGIAGVAWAPRSSRRIRSSQARAILRFEGLALLLFALFVVVFGLHYGTRALGERALDLGLVTSLSCAAGGFPEDFWFARERLNAYFLGSWTAAVMGRGVAVSPHHAYLAALAVTWIEGLAACGLLARTLGARRRGLFVVPLAVLFTGNGAVAYHWLRGVDLLSPRAQLLVSHVIPFSINENPFAAFWVSELHAHVMVMPALIVWVAVAVAMLRRRSRSLAAVLGILSALVAMTDAWMIPPAVVCGALLLLVCMPVPPRFLFAAGGWCVASVVLASSVVLLGYDGYPLIVREVERSTTRIEHLGVLFGPLLVLVGLARAAGPTAPMRQRTGYGILLAGLLLVWLPEAIYLENWIPSPSERQNTVFRFHFAAWIFIAGSLGALWPRTGAQRWAFPTAIAWSVAFAALAALPGVARWPGAGFDCDVRRPLDREANGAAEAAAWLSENSACGTVIAESGGSPYQGLATVAAMSGRTALLGEYDKVHSHGVEFERIDERFKALRTIYCDSPDAEAVLRGFRVRFILLGPPERRLFADCEPERLLRKYPIAFRSNRTWVLRVGDAAG